MENIEEKKEEKIWEAQEYFIHLVFQTQENPRWSTNETQIHTTIYLMDSLKNGPENYVLIDEGSFIVVTTGSLMDDSRWRE